MNDATQQPEEGHLENQEAKAPEAAEAAPAPEAAPEVEPEVTAEAPVVEEPTPSEPRELAKPAGDFDWDAFESEQDDYSADERKRLEDLYEESLTLIKEKEVVEGTVISIGKKEVVVNIGYKSEGVIGASEFRYNPEMKAGDKVPVFIEKQEDANGQLVVSHKTARIYDAWDKVNKAKEEDIIIQGSVKCRTKGGLIVDVFGLEAFLPGSQVDVKPIRDFDESKSGSRWSSRVSKSTKSLRMWWCRTRRSLRPSSKSRSVLSFRASKWVRFSKELSRTSPLMVCLWTSEVSMVWCTLPT